MKHSFLIITAALLAPRFRVFRTANAKAEDTTPPAPSGISPEVQAILDQQSAQIAGLQKQLEEKNAATAEVEDTSALALLCRGAGVELRDVRWRVQAGLDPEQAVQAAVTQKASDARKAEEQKKKKKTGGNALLSLLIVLALVFGFAAFSAPLLAGDPAVAPAAFAPIVTADHAAIAAIASPAIRWVAPVLVLGLALLAIVLRWVKPHLRHRWGMLRTANAESTTGTHGGVDTKLADASMAYRYLLLKVGSDADHVAVCGASDVPIAVSSDQAAAAEDPINVTLLGISRSTVKMMCATAIAAQTDVYAAASGFVVALPGSAGTYYRVGRTRAAATIHASNVYIAEVEPCQPEKVLVIAAASGTAATDIAALFTALQGGPARIKAL